MTRSCCSPCLLAAAAFASAADAQTLGTATYHIEFGNGSNQVFLAPGESTTVTVLVSFSPGIGVVIGSAPPLQGPVLGLNDGSFSITGTPSGGGATGNFGLLPGPNHPSLVAPYNWLPGIATQPGTPAGNSVNGVVWGLGFLFQPLHPLPANPGVVWTGTFTVAPASGGGTIDLAFTGLGPTGILVSSSPPGGAIPWVATYGSAPGLGATIVVPGPAAALAFALAGIPAARRSRREVLP